MAEKGVKKPKKEEIARQPMPEQEPAVRAKNFEEVPFGLSAEAAQQEAQRCLQCKKPACVQGCPVEVDIPGFIRLVKEGDFTGAIAKVWEKNSLPAVCGRVCPQELQCEGNCIVGKKDQPVAIGNLERFAADYERNSGNISVPELHRRNGIKVASIGSGPAGLAFAGDALRASEDHGDDSPRASLAICHQASIGGAAGGMGGAAAEKGGENRVGRGRRRLRPIHGAAEVPARRRLRQEALPRFPSLSWFQ